MIQELSNGLKPPDCRRLGRSGRCKRARRAQESPSEGCGQQSRNDSDKCTVSDPGCDPWTADSCLRFLTSYAP
ncbi:hypothetical protein MIC448_2350003 [Microbacterium sp. C448]|nr:hypothetical protein MIC448_2350003 [Microbacterium sp. C448]